MKNTVFYLFGFSFITFMLSSCATTNIPYGKIADQGVTIRAEDNSYTLESGDYWRSPRVKGSKKVNTTKNILDYYKKALDKGEATRVKVKVPGIDKELYGVLLLNKVGKSVRNPASRSYRISIPEKYIEGALDGRMSVVYECSNCSGNGEFKPKRKNMGLKIALSILSPPIGLPMLIASALKKEDNGERTWVLWLSDEPF